MFKEMIESLSSIPSWFTGMAENNLTSVIILFGILLLLVAVLIVITAKSKKEKWTAQELAIGAICIALAFVLSYVRIWKMPQGGSITLASMLPIMVFAYIYGVKKGFIVGLTYGLLQMIQDPWVVHPIQAILDYGVAFTVLAFAGMSKNKIVPGMIFASVLRFLSHFISGAVFFAEYAPEGQSVLVYSALYNSFVFFDVLICIVIVLVPPVMKLIKKRKAEVKS